MQKSLRINLLARNQAVKRAHKKQQQETKEEWKEWLQIKILRQRKSNQYLREERQVRREDWTSGPLAPNRNAGGMYGTFGAVDALFSQSGKIPKAVRRSPKSKGSEALINDEGGFRGKGMVGNVVVNDRVVVVNGPESIRGKIGVVSKIDEELEEVTVEGINITDVQVPSTTPSFQGERNPLISTVETPIPMNDVRLIVRFSNPDTGTDRDFVVREVVGGPPYTQYAHGKSTPSHTRYVGGTGEVLPWPVESGTADFPRNDVDTARQALSRRSFMPSIMSSPLLPSTPLTSAASEKVSKSIMDELRSSKQRAKVQHDDEALVRRKILEDARSLWWRDRKFTSPAAEKATLGVAERQVKEELQRDHNQLHGGVDPETLSIIQDMQSITLGNRRRI